MNLINKIEDAVLKVRTHPKKTDIRGNYYRDQTAIIHSLPFRRLKKKTQVFFAPTNDHICTRIEHVLHVTSVATTICKGLGLDIELAQAIALGHDLGHPPFGHAGETVLNEIQKSIGKFYIHEIYSFRIVEYIANKGKGLNLCHAVKDGIISHCGEKYEQFIKPDFTVVNLNKIGDRSKYPCTYEGCVVRLSDKISYLGRDIEDAIRLGVVNKKNITKKILDVLGVAFNGLKNSINSLIIDRLINDAIEFSKENNVIGISKESHDMMKAVRDFNYEVIYNSEILLDYTLLVKKVLNIIYEELNNVFEKHKFNIENYKNHFIEPFRDFAKYLEGYKNFYQKTNIDTNTIIVDYIAGMTDDYALDFCKKVILPKRIF